MSQGPQDLFTLLGIPENSVDRTIEEILDDCEDARVVEAAAEQLARFGQQDAGGRAYWELADWFLRHYATFIRAGGRRIP